MLPWEYPFSYVFKILPFARGGWRGFDEIE
jgi:hypothetical protein